MKKFKEFKVRTYGIKSLSKALVRHAQHIGYEHDNDNDDYDWFWCGKKGDCALCNTAGKSMTLSLDEFFRLTPKDVIVEPEKTLWSFCQEEVRGVDLVRRKLTQSQIDEIKAIMERES